MKKTKAQIPTPVIPEILDKIPDLFAGKLTRLDCDVPIKGVFYQASLYFCKCGKQYIARLDFRPESQKL